MHMALLERLWQNRCKLMTKTILLLPKFVLSKMNHESEHSQSKFYYPGELSHAELLHQSPTHSESKERNLTLLANEEFAQLSQKPTSKQAVKETTFPDKLSDN